MSTHLRWAGGAARLEITRSSPPAEGECLLGTPQYDFHWQGSYAYAAANVDALPSLSAGDTLRLTCTYDNTMDNPRVAKTLAEHRIGRPYDLRRGLSMLDETCFAVVTTVRAATALD